MMEAAGRLPNLFRARGLILLYHRVAQAPSDPWSLTVSPDHFAEHLEILKNSYRIVSLEQLTRGNGNRAAHGSIAITFDDGYVDNLTTAKPLLERYDAPATIFLSPGALGNPKLFWWDELDRLLLRPGILPRHLELQIGEISIRRDLAEDAEYDEASARENRCWSAWDAPPTRRHALYTDLWKLLQQLDGTRRAEALAHLGTWGGARPEVDDAERPLVAEEVPELVAGNLVEVGAHTMTHPALATLSASEQHDEIVRSKLHLEEMIGGTVTSFAYPFGGKQDYTRDTVRLVRQSGFARACSSFSGPVTRVTDHLQLPRIYMSDWDGDEFAIVLRRWLGGGHRQPPSPARSR